jgi:hypothetical protein
MWSPTVVAAGILAGLMAVPAAPTRGATSGVDELTVDRPSVTAGEQVTVGGSCEISVVELFLSDVGLTLEMSEGDVRDLGPLVMDEGTGQLDSRSVTIPEDVPAGNHVLASSCGAVEALEVLAAPDTPTPDTPTPDTPTPDTPTPDTPTPDTPTPTGQTPDALLPVPDLGDLTEAEARAALGVDLVLAGDTGEGRVTEQSPQPGERVARGSAVTIELADAVVPWIPATLVIVGAFAAALVLSRVLRPRRERRWLDRHVRARVGRAEWDPSSVPDVAVPGVVLRFEVWREPAELHLQEVGRAHD